MVMMRDRGRPLVCYGKNCPEKEQEHELWVTEIELDLEVEMKRHHRVGKAFADGFFIRDGIKYFVEMDNHTATRKQWRAKIDAYGTIPGFILVVCHTRRRMRRLMQASEGAKDSILFTRFRWLKSKVKAKAKWIDMKCKRVEI